MITFKQFISESPYTPIAMSDGQSIEWCERNSPKYLERMGQNPIFRGFDAPELGHINTNRMNRTSANTRNYYTIWMDNDKDWVEYPKRSKALICSTSVGTASGFGEVQIFVPADINKIGLCSENDLWGSFRFLADRLGMKFHSMDEFVDAMHIFMAKVHDSHMLDDAQKNYTVLVDRLKAVTIDKLKEVVNTGDSRDRFAVPYIRAFEKYGYKNLYDLWRDMMQPEENDFHVLTADKFKAGYDREIWIQGECATVNYDYFERGRSDEKHPLYEFINKHNLRNVVNN